MFDNSLSYVPIHKLTKIKTNLQKKILKQALQINILFSLFHQFTLLCQTHNIKIPTLIKDISSKTSRK